MINKERRWSTMLPIAIQIGSIIAGKVVVHGIYKILKD